METWKDIKGYEGRYQVSSSGQVKGPRKILKPFVSRFGYAEVNLHKQGKAKIALVHRLVAQAFLLNSKGSPCVNHLDGDKGNNCVDNLEWCTHQENTNHAILTGLRDTRGENNGYAKLTKFQVGRLRLLKSIFPRIKQKDLGKLFSVNQGHTGKILRRDLWSHI